ncbi:hypothetical protein GINT2_000792 [Glugoides intestinalis]
MDICAITWNTHGKSFIPGIDSTLSTMIISLQECYTVPEITALKARFKEVKVSSMYGLKTIIASKKPLKTRFIKLGQGYFGFINKGFIATIINNDIIHVNAHLAAHEWNNKKRISQLKEMLRLVDSKVNTVILTGDLNFRCVPGDQAEEFKRQFLDFEEAKINFKPTYKFNKSEYVKSRSPSFCDRVMIASKFATQFIKYYSIEKICESDHKPVVCEFKILNSKSKEKLFDGDNESMFLRRKWTALILLLTEKETQGWAGALLLTALIRVIRYFLYKKRICI